MHEVLLRVERQLANEPCGDGERHIGSADLEAAPQPITPPPPVRFSTITCFPERAAHLPRDNVVGTPGANGTMVVTGLVGWPCAVAKLPVPARNAALSRCLNLNLCMLRPLGVGAPSTLPIYPTASIGNRGPLLRWTTAWGAGASWSAFDFAAWTRTAKRHDFRTYLSLGFASLTPTDSTLLRPGAAWARGSLLTDQAQNKCTMPMRKPLGSMPGFLPAPVLVTAKPGVGLIPNS